MSCCNTKRIKNTGTSPVPYCGVEPAKIYAMQTYADDGTLNRLDLSEITTGDGTVNLAYLKTLINHTDKSKRLYPLPLLFSSDVPMVESIKEQAQSQHNVKVKDGIRTAKYIFSGVGHKEYGILKSLECMEYSIFVIDAINNTAGKDDTGVDAGKYLVPYKVQPQTTSVDWTEHQGTTKTKATLSLEFSQFDKVEDTLVITANEMAVDMLSLKGLYNVYLQPATAISTTGFKVKLNSDFATALTNIRWENQPKTAFTVYNTTTSASVVVADAVDANSDGEHEISFLAQTSADVLRVTFAKEGFETSAPILVTIP